MIEEQRKQDETGEKFENSLKERFARADNRKRKNNEGVEPRCGLAKYKAKKAKQKQAAAAAASNTCGAAGSSLAHGNPTVLWTHTAGHLAGPGTEVLSRARRLGGVWGGL